MKENNLVDTVVEVRRVTKVTKGGKRFGFSVFVVSGDQNGHVGFASGKGKDVAAAIAKATVKARKQMIAIATRNTTLPYDVEGSHGACKVVLRAAYQGTGLIAGGAVRAVMTALGVKDVLAKSIGPSRSGQNLVKATLNALAKCRTAEHIAHLRGKSVKELVKE